MNVPLLDVPAQNAPLREELLGVFEQVLDSGYFILGPEVEAFENEAAEYLGVPHTIGVSSGTDALIVALLAAGVGPGDEVICPSFTFFATAGSVVRVGATPVFVDSEEESFNIDLESAKSRLTSKTKAIIPVHLFGRSCEITRVVEFAEEHDLFVIEDTAQSLSAGFESRKCGTFGHFGTYSFFPSKNLGGFGDGGLVSCQDQELAEKVRRLRNHGMHPKYYHAVVGGNFRIDALQAALLRKKLPHLDSYGEARAENAAYYLQEFADLDSDQVSLPLPGTAKEGVIWNQFTLRVHGKRDELKAHLLENQVGCEVYYPVPLHQQECFSHLKSGALPVSEKLSAEVLSIPIFGELGEQRRARVVEVVKSFFKS
ncbi:DegT/DnrJ/EryC1/StrS family aminotransferase [Akkermansiaceae bacterium]|nr:DegT/DnrJ/EryC1/StrS family aminotransferase [Akkermansiaceae bacterium]MDA7887891.1 DegT/DnrJ/EryC1/StrS family aminotransferase [Akkermansiaceae bacterium]MDB4537278.1 DegT/DnrJ/EryC1/StrS family aminotransferase [Akkermansiaceae bacterium]